MDLKPQSGLLFQLYYQNCELIVCSAYGKNKRVKSLVQTILVFWIQ